MPQRHAPATGRNRSYILAVLKEVLPASGTVLEIASGTGEHAVYFAPELKPRHWLPSDLATENLASIDAWRAEFPSDNLYPPIVLDVTTNPWPVEDTPPADPVTAIVNINMIHISPWACCESLFAGAGRLLPAGGVIYLYGPFKRDGVHTAPSNEAFDKRLRMQDPRWGVRDLEEVVALAESQAFQCKDVIEMPANNLSVVFHRS